MKEKEKKEEKLKVNKIALVVGILSLVIIIFLFVKGSFVKEDDSRGRGDQKEIEETQIVDYENTLPENFPEDFPVYENSEIISASGTQGGEKEGLSVMWRTTDDFDEVVQFYNTRLNSDDWEIENFFEDEEELSATYTFSKGDTKGFLGITKGEGEEVFISVAVGII